jgi:hypothetical protein
VYEITKNFDGSPIPNHTIASGTSAIAGIGRSSDRNGFSAKPKIRVRAVRRPTATPSVDPIANPTAGARERNAQVAHQQTFLIQLDGREPHRVRRREQLRIDPAADGDRPPNDDDPEQRQQCLRELVQRIHCGRRLPLMPGISTNSGMDFTRSVQRRSAG